MQAEIYKADFLEERKDRERARGELADMQRASGQDLAFHEERLQLHKEIHSLKQECNELKTERARNEAIARQREMAIEMLSREKESYKHKAEMKEKELRDADKQILAYRHEVEQLKEASVFEVLNLATWE